MPMRGQTLKVSENKDSVLLGCKPPIVSRRCLCLVEIFRNLKRRHGTTDLKHTEKIDENIKDRACYQNRISPNAHGSCECTHAELTKMDLLLKERGWDQSKFCQIWGKESKCRAVLRWKQTHTWSVKDASKLQTCQLKNSALTQSKCPPVHSMLQLIILCVLTSILLE